MAGTNQTVNQRNGSLTIISATHDHNKPATSDRVLTLEEGLIKDIKTKGKAPHMPRGN
jgi:hypothetical protein